MKLFKTCILKFVLIALSNWKYKMDFKRQKISGFCLESKILKGHFPVVIIITIKIKPSSNSQIFNPIREWMSQSNKLTWNLRGKKKCFQRKENMNTCLLGVDASGNQ